MSTTYAPTMVGPSLHGTSMTPEEFDAIEEWDDDYVYELVNGVLVVSPAPLAAERGPNELLGYWLRKYQEFHPLGSSLDYTLNEHQIRTVSSRRRADRLIWTGLGRLPHFRTDRPSIAVEFVSVGKRNAKRDYIEKRDEYAGLEIPEYWVVDRFRRIMTVYRTHQANPTEHVFHEHDVYTTPLLPGFELPLAKLLAECDLTSQD